MAFVVACVLKSGGIYDAEWVRKLNAGVAKHLPVDHRFVCLSDVDVPCERIPLEHDWPGWWAKIELFKLDGPVLFFDLDTVIVGDLSDIAGLATRTPFAALRDFYRPEGIGSGVMAWRGDVSALYDAFAADPEGWQAHVGKRGDQGFIEDVADLASIARLQDAMPGQIVSYKAHHCKDGIPDDARVVCLHGKPKFSGMPEGDPVRAAWDAL